MIEYFFNKGGVVMKKILAIAMVFVMVLTFAACGSKYKEGTYEGEGKGYSPDENIKVNVTVDADGKVSEVKVVSHSETDEIGGTALESLTKAAVEKNGANVDTITGATVTTDGFKAAVKQALEKAK